MDGTFWRCARCSNYVEASVTICSCEVTRPYKQQETVGAYMNLIQPAESQFLPKKQNDLNTVHQINYQGDKEISQYDSNQYSMNMSSEIRNYGKSQEYRGFPSAHPYYQEREFVQSNASYPNGFQYSDRNFSMFNSSIQQAVPEPGIIPDLQYNIENPFEVKDAQFRYPDQSNISSSCTTSGSYENRSFVDSSEFQTNFWQTHQRNIGPIVSPINECRSPAQDYSQESGLCPSLTASEFFGFFNQYETTHYPQALRENRNISKKSNHPLYSQSFPDPRRSIYFQTSGDNQLIQESGNFTGENSVTIPRNNPASYIEINPCLINESLLDSQENVNFMPNNYNEREMLYNSNETNIPFRNSHQMSQETATEIIASDKQIKNMLNAFPSNQTTFEKSMASTFPASIQQANNPYYLSSEVYSKQSSTPQCENMFSGYMSRNISRCENVPASMTNNANIHQRNDYFTNSSQNDSHFQTDRNLLRNNREERHIQTDVIQRPYRCDVCQKGFSNPSYLRRHYIIHTNFRPYQCDICHERFLEKWSLTIHSRIHTNERRFQCDICHKVFIHKSNLTTHIRSHTNERPFQCNICQYRFKHNCHLKWHILNVHKK